jgi:hypothetical protein
MIHLTIIPSSGLVISLYYPQIFKGREKELDGHFYLLSQEVGWIKSGDSRFMLPGLRNRALAEVARRVEHASQVISCATVGEALNREPTEKEHGRGKETTEPGQKEGS